MINHVSLVHLCVVWFIWTFSILPCESYLSWIFWVFSYLAFLGIWLYIFFFILFLIIWIYIFFFSLLISLETLSWLFHLTKSKVNFLISARIIKGLWNTITLNALSPITYVIMPNSFLLLFCLLRLCTRHYYYTQMLFIWVYIHDSPEYYFNLFFWIYWII